MREAHSGIPKQKYDMFHCNNFLSLFRNLSFLGYEFLHGHLKDKQSSLGSMWEMVMTPGLHRKDAVEGAFQVIIWFQPKSTRASSKHRVHWGMLLVWSLVSSCNHHTKSMNLPMHTPRISGLRTVSWWAPSASGCHRTSLSWHQTERPWKEPYRGYKPTESTVPWVMTSSTLQPFVPVLPPTEVTELGTISVLPTRGMQLRTVPETACMSTSPRDLTGAEWLGSSPTVQQHWAQERSPGWLQRSLPAKIQIGWQASSKDEQDHLRGTARKGQIGVLKAYPALAWVTSGSASPGDEITVLRLLHQARGMKAADSTELTLDDPRVSASLMVLCTFFSLSTSSSLSYLRHWFPALNKEDVKSTEFDQLPGIWLGYKDFDILQKLRIRISCCCSQVYVTVFILKKTKPFQEQIKPNKDVSSSCTFVPRHTQTGWLTGYPFAICFQV